jgi:small subunit ribosomal protein S20
MLANIRSAKKRMRQNPKRQARNQQVRTRARTYVKLARASMDGQDSAAAEEAVKLAISELDRAAAKGVIHANNASRRKARLMKQLAKTHKGP